MKQFFDTEFLENQLFGDSRQENADGEPEEIQDGYGEIADSEEEEGLPVELTLSLADGSRLNCRVSGVFIEQDEEYIALETDDGMIYLMGLSQGEEDELKLRLLEDEQEQERAMTAFFRMLEEEDYAARERYNDALSEKESYNDELSEKES